MAARTTEDVIKEALIARIEQLTGQLDEARQESRNHRIRASELETALNNVIGSVPENVRARYAAVLERNRERRH